MDSIFDGAFQYDERKKPQNQHIEVPSDSEGEGGEPRH